MWTGQVESVLIVGKKGTGKTTWARDFIKSLTRVLVLEAGYGEYGIPETENFSEVMEKMRHSFFRVSYSPMAWEYEYLFAAALTVGEQKPIWLVLEEAQGIESPKSFELYSMVINRGRHHGINMIVISTRPALLPIDYRAQATRVIAFRQHEPADIDYLSNIIGDDALNLKGLQGHDYIEWREDANKTGGKNDIQATPPGGKREPAGENS